MMKRIIVLAICFLLIALFFYYLPFDIERIIEQFQELSALSILFFALWQLVTIALLVVQWQLFLKARHMKSSFIDLWNVQMLGIFLESITPGAKIGAESLRLYYFTKKYTQDVSQSMAIIVLQKIYSMIAFSSFFLLLFLGAFSIMPIDLVQQRQVVLLVFVFFALLLAGLFIARIPKVAQFFSRFFEHLKESWHDKKEVCTQLFLSLVIWGFYPLKGIVLAVLFDLPLTVYQLVIIMMISYIVAQLPLTPGGIGTFEASLITLFVMYDVPNDVALVYTIFFRFMTHWFIVVVSIPFLFGKTNRTLYRSIQQSIMKRRRRKYGNASNDERKGIPCENIYKGTSR